MYEPVHIFVYFKTKASSLRLEYSLLKVTIINKLESNLMIQVIRFMQNLDVKFQYETGSFGIAGI